MLADSAANETRPPETPDPTAQRSERGRTRSRGAAGLAFVGATGLVLLYGLRGGGSYDAVAFEEYGLVIWWVLALGIVLGLLPRSRPSRWILLLLGALGAYAGWTALSLTWTVSSELTTRELARSLDYLGLVGLLASAVDRHTWRAAASGLGFGAMLVCVAAVGSRLAPNVFGSDHVDAVLHIDRLSVPFGYWNSVAAWGAMCTAVGLAWSVHDTSRLRRGIALGLVPVAVLTTYLTYSRAGVAGTTVAVVAVLALSRNRFTAVIHIAVAAAGAALPILAVRSSFQIAHGAGTDGAQAVLGALLFAALLCIVAAALTSAARIDRWRLPRRAVRPLGAAVALVALLVASAFGPRLASREWHSFTGMPPAQTSPGPASSDPTARLSSLSGTRYPLWKSAIKAFDAHPASGTGAGTFQYWWNVHATNDEFIRDAHNIWLQNMAELGVPGLLLIVVALCTALALGIAVRRRTRRSASAGSAAACVAAFIVYLVHASVDWMWESTAVTVFALGGIAIVGGRLGEGTLRLRISLRVALATLATIAGALQVPALLSSAEVRRSQAAERAGNTSLALGWAQDAVNAEPWSASAYEQRGLVRESAGRLQNAAADLNQAISHEPQNYEHWLILARIETELGKVDMALRDYNRARQLRPRASVFVLAPYFRTRSP